MAGQGVQYPKEARYDAMPETVTSTSPIWLPLFTALGGYVIGFISEWFRDRRASRREREAREAARREQQVREAEQRYHENIEKSVVGFVDEMLTLISRAYWNKADGREPGIGSILEVFREKEASIQARLKAMRRPDVEKYFFALDNSYVQFCAALPKAPGGNARDLMKEAWSHAGDLFEAVYGLAPTGAYQRC